MNPEKMLKDLEELFIEYNDTTEFENYRIEIAQDFDPLNPRKDYDNLGTMVCFHNRYDLGDKHGYETSNVFAHVLSGLYPDEITAYLEDDEIEKCWNAVHEKNIVLPLYLYDHSGITMRTTSFSCGWDSGCVGVIYVSLEDVRKEYGWKRITKKRRERIEGYLRGEVEIYDHYLTGSVYGFNIEREDPDGEEEHVDSCWGFFGYYTDDEGYMISVIKDAIKYDINHTPAQLDLL